MFYLQCSCLMVIPNSMLILSGLSCFQVYQAFSTVVFGPSPLLFLVLAFDEAKHAYLISACLTLGWISAAFAQPAAVSWYPFCGLVLQWTDSSASHGYLVSRPPAELTSHILLSKLFLFLWLISRNAKIICVQGSRPGYILLSLYKVYFLSPLC